MPRRSIIVGSRRTALALAQTELVAEPLRRAGHWVEVLAMHTAGDRSLGGSLTTAKGMFTADLDRARLAREVDLAVHSLKDLPLEVDPLVELAAIPPREHPHDLLVVRAGAGQPHDEAAPLAQIAEGSFPVVPAKQAFAALAHGACIGTSSPRRQAGALALRPDLVCVAARGSVDRRLERLRDGAVDALLLAEAGVVRLLRAAAGVTHRSDQVARSAVELLAFRLDLASWPTAPGQGALAVQARADDSWAAAASRSALDHDPTRDAVTLERTLLSALGGGCSLPMGATLEGESLHVAIAAPDWRRHAGAGSAPAWIHRSLEVADLDVERAASDLSAAADAAARAAALPAVRALRLADDEAPPTLVVTSTRTAAARLCAALARERDVATLEVTTRRPEHAGWPVDRLVLGDDRRHWPWVLVSSPGAAEVLVERCALEPDWLRLGWCALGRGTARALLELGVPAGLCAGGRDAAELAEFALRHLDPAARLFLPQSSLASPALADRLRAAGRDVESFTAYTVEPRRDLRWPAAWPATEVTLFTAPSAASAWAEARLPWPGESWAIGESTATELRRLGAPNIRRAESPTPTALAVLARDGAAGPRRASNEDRPS